MPPVDIAIAETVKFVERFTPPAVSVLEVGCGEGDLALALAHRSLQVLGVDVDEAAVAATRAKGVPAVHIDFLKYTADPFAVVLFTRSLHHIHPIAAAVRKAYELTCPGGALIVEDFAAEEADEKTVAWRYDAEMRLKENHPDLYAPEQGRGQKTGTMEEWQQHFTKHNVTPGKIMQATIESQYGAVIVERAPYLYRYVIAKVRCAERAEETAAQFLTEEMELIARGTVLPIGLRIVARRMADR